MDSVITVITNNKSKDRKEDIVNKSHIKTLKVALLYTVRGMQTAAVSIGNEAFAFFFIPNTRHLAAEVSTPHRIFNPRQKVLMYGGPGAGVHGHDWNKLMHK